MSTDSCKRRGGTFNYYITDRNLVYDVTQFSKREGIKNSFMSVNQYNGRLHSTADLKHETSYATVTCKWTETTKTITVAVQAKRRTVTQLRILMY